MARYCFGIFASLITCAQRSISARMNLSNSSRVVGAGGIPSSVRRFSTSGARNASVYVGVQLVDNAATPAGAHTPRYQEYLEVGHTASCDRRHVPAAAADASRYATDQRADAWRVIDPITAAVCS